MYLFVIGPGYVGKAFCQKYRGKFSHITVTTRDRSKIPVLKECADDVLVLDEPLSAAVIPSKTNVILLCAGADSLQMYKNTYEGLTSFIQTAASTLPNLRQILYTSSTSVYNEDCGNVVTENSLLSNTPTAKILLQAEQNLLSIPSIPVTVLRLGQIIGEGRSLEERAKKIAGHTLPGDGSAITNFSPLLTICKALAFCIDHKLSGIYNVVCDMHITRKELYDTLCQRLSLPSVKWDPFHKTIHSSKKSVSSDKLKQTGFRDCMEGEFPDIFF